ncbi:BLUF domain-containing protein [Hymenobacter lapidiphilus]|uniref:BLUF domain-containing protein n=1 Tax=Hymenobacter lapidiphilus TaxID=2608003 RepID=A0A7Y7PPJ5_9BACT|nr:BLUF domain-containing protein [Hymenobacter lapidiphilus]NVO31565.1 BLUF domain-containing protein [Hymenobacter lapidiphilus]
MIHLVYISVAAQDIDDLELRAMLDKYRHYNTARGITGMLFYSNRHIAQILEGEADVVEPLYEEISSDTRHINVVKMIHKTITQRSFAEWSMAFHPLDEVGFAHLEGFLLPSEVSQNPASLSMSDALVINLMRDAVFGAPSSPDTDSAAAS